MSDGVLYDPLTGCILFDGDCVLTGPCSNYRQARLCSDDSLANVWMTTADALTRSGAFYVNNILICYYFNFVDATSNSPGTIYAASASVAKANCAACPGCASVPCDGTTSYQVDMSGLWNVIVSCAVNESANAPTAQPVTFLATGSCGFNPDSGDLPIYLASGQSTSGNNSIEVTGTPALDHINDPYGSGCSVWRFVIALAIGSAYVSVEFLGPTGPNAAGNYYYYQDSGGGSPFVLPCASLTNLPVIVVT